MELITKLIDSRPVNLAVSALLAALWFSFAVNHTNAYLETGRIAFLVFCFSETLQGIFFLVRRMPKRVATDPFAWLVGVFGSFAFVFVRPGGMTILPYGDAVLIIGVLLQVLGLLSLNRSFAIVAAERKIVTSGMYRLVRHPMYLGYFFLFAGYLMFNSSLNNWVVVIATLILLFLRIEEEERLLKQNAEFLAYTQKVRWRVIPFVY